MASILTEKQKAALIAEAENELTNRIQVRLSFEVRELFANDLFAVKPIYPPKGGMHLVTMGLVKIKDRNSGKLNAATDIKIDNQNKVRLRGIGSIHVDDIVDLLKISNGYHRMEAGGYCPTAYEPPVVAIKLNKDGTFNKVFGARLITGKHRAEGHIKYYLTNPLTKEVWMWVAICVFDNDQIMDEYASQENNRKILKKYSSFEDIVQQLQIAIVSKYCTTSEQVLTTYLKENLLWEGPTEDGKKVKDVIEEVRKLIGKPLERPLEIPTKIEIKLNIKDTFDIEIDEKKDPSTFLYTMRADTTVESTDRFLRLEKKITELWLKGYYNIKVFCGLSDCKESTLDKARIMVKEQFTSQLISKSENIVKLNNKITPNKECKIDKNSIEFIFYSATEEERAESFFLNYDSEGNLK